MNKFTVSAHEVYDIMGRLPFNWYKIFKDKKEIANNAEYQIGNLNLELKVENVKVENVEIISNQIHRDVEFEFIFKDTEWKRKIKDLKQFDNFNRDWNYIINYGLNGYILNNEDAWRFSDNDLVLIGMIE